jgi:hypothetical protein
MELVDRSVRSEDPARLLSAGFNAKMPAKPSITRFVADIKSIEQRKERIELTKDCDGSESRLQRRREGRWARLT